MNSIKYLLYITLIASNLVPAVMHAMGAQMPASEVGGSSSSSSATAAGLGQSQVVNPEALYFALFLSKIDEVKKYLKQDPQCVNAALINLNQHECSPLGVAIRSANPNMVELLLKNGADIAILAYDYNGKHHTNAYDLAVDLRDNADALTLKSFYSKIVDLLKAHLDIQASLATAKGSESSKANVVAPGAAEAQAGDVANSPSWITVQNMAIAGTVTVVGIFAAAGYYFFGTQVDADEEEQQE